MEDVFKGDEISHVTASSAGQTMTCDNRVHLSPNPGF